MRSLCAFGARRSPTSIDGQVTKVDESAGKITIKHGPIKKLDMEDGMTMVFSAGSGDAQAVKAGDKIKFDAESVNGQFMVTKIPENPNESSRRLARRRARGAIDLRHSAVRAART